MNLSTVKSITIPAGNVTALSIGGVKVWGGGSSGDEPAELLSWEGVAYHINKGTYKDVYAIGDMVPLDLGSEGLINMQIAAFDVDTLADGSGTAAITWIGVELLKTTRLIHDTAATVYSWETSVVRNYLSQTVSGLIPQNVVGMIQSVIKQQSAYDISAGSASVQSTNDKLWIPTDDEIGSSSKDGSYSVLYAKAETARRKKNLAGSSSATNWWTRDAAGRYFTYYNKSGSTSGSATQMSYAKGVCLGFCTGKTPT